MAYTPAQRKTALERNPLRCPCQVDVSAPPVRTKSLGLTRPRGTMHAARHRADCPHSELVVTAFRLTRGSRKRAKAIAVEMYRKRHRTPNRRP